MRLFRAGLSTGSCAAASTKAAAQVLATGESPAEVTIGLPDGSREKLAISFARRCAQGAQAQVIKDGGDDPDVTHRCRIVASVSWAEPGNAITFRAGEGVGTVTRPGLSIPPSEPAINPVPRQMIHNAVREITDRGVVVTIAVPGGVEIAAKTFNPRLGIIGGISILGTSGRVRPFSTPAMREAIRCLFQVARCGGVDAPILVPGRIGERASKKRLRVRDLQLIEVGNEWGFALDAAKALAFNQLLLVGHPGKLAKLAQGHFNTHSSNSPSALPGLKLRAELLAKRSMAETPTVQGLFCYLSADEKKCLANDVATRIARVAGERASLPVSVLLVDMEGNILGGAGDLSPWT